MSTQSIAWSMHTMHEMTESIDVRPRPLNELATRPR